MIDVMNEKLLSLSQAAGMIPPGRRGRPVTVSCVLRWILTGVKTPAGLVKLDGIRLGGRWLTSAESLARFAEAQTLRSDAPQPVAKTPAKQLRAAERAGKQLEKMGIK